MTTYQQFIQIMQRRNIERQLKVSEFGARDQYMISLIAQTICERMDPQGELPPELFARANALLEKHNRVYLDALALMQTRLDQLEQEVKDFK